MAIEDTRVSNVTSFRRGFHSQTDWRYAGGMLAHTDVFHVFKEERFYSRYEGHLTPLQVEELEERFFERRHARRTRPREVF